MMVEAKNYFAILPKGNLLKSNSQKCQDSPVLISEPKQNEDPVAPGGGGGASDINHEAQRESLFKRISELVREKEHWIVEVQIMQMKLQQRNSSAESNDERNRTESPDDGHVAKMIEQHYASRIEELTMELQQADSRSSIFYDEVKVDLNCSRILISLYKF